MPPPPLPEDAPEDSFLRDPSALDGFLEDVRSDPAEGGAPAPDGGPVETPREVSVEVEQARLDAEAVPAEAAAGDGAAAGTEPAEATEAIDDGPRTREPASEAAEAADPAEAEPAAGAPADPERFWGSGFEPATAADEAEAAEEGGDGGGIAAKLAKLGRLMRRGGD